MRSQRWSCALSSVTALVALLVAAPVVAQEPDSEYDVPSATTVHFIDLEDGGDNPMEPGCHWHYENDECSAPQFFFQGDTCSSDGKFLFEWTNPRCHEPEDDIKRYNCEEVCRERFGTSGRCVVAPRHCQGRRGRTSTNFDSASCVCNEESESE